MRVWKALIVSVIESWCVVQSDTEWKNIDTFDVPGLRLCWLYHLRNSWITAMIYGWSLPGSCLPNDHYVFKIVWTLLWSFIEIFHLFEILFKTIRQTQVLPYLTKLISLLIFLIEKWIVSMIHFLINILRISIFFFLLVVFVG